MAKSCGNLLDVSGLREARYHRRPRLIGPFPKPGFNTLVPLVCFATNSDPRYTTSRYVRETAEDLCGQVLASICQKEAEIAIQWLRSREEELRTGARKMASTKTMPTIEGCKRLVYFDDRGQVIADTGKIKTII